MSARVWNWMTALAVGSTVLMAQPTLAQTRTAPAADCGAHSDPVACRREAAAARAAARAGALTDGDKAHALARCEVVPPAEQATCRRRIEQGTVSGSVEGGGRLIEYREVIELPR